MININEILKIEYSKNGCCYIGLLRNKKKFEIDDKVFFSKSKYDLEIFAGTIIGKEKTISDNTEFIYKIELSKKIATDVNGNVFSNIICDSIFNNITEAKNSAIECLDLHYKLDKNNIEEYFSQFNSPLST